MTSQLPPGMEGHWSRWSAPVAPPPEPPASRSARRLMLLAGLLSLLLLAVVANSLLHGDEGPLNPIAQAAEKTQRAAGARLSIETIYSTPALRQPVVATGGGAFNSETGRSRIELSVPIDALRTMRVTAVADPRRVYMRSREISRDLPPGRHWLAIEPGLGGNEELTVAGSGNAGDQLRMLAAVGGVRRVGAAEVRGVATTRYRGRVEIGRLAARLAAAGNRSAARLYRKLARRAPAPIRVEAWIDANGMTRRARTVLTEPPNGERASRTTDTRIELFGFGAEPKVNLPAKRRVFDLTPLSRAELHLIDGSQMLPSPAAAGKPLSAGALRTRANKTCSGIRAEIDEMAASARAEIEAMEHASGQGQEAVLRAYRRLVVAFYDPLMRRFESWLAEMVTLRPPAQLARRYASYLRQTARGGELFLASVRAFELGAFARGLALEARSERTDRRVDRLGKSLGLDKCLETEEERGGAATATPA